MTEESMPRKGMMRAFDYAAGQPWAIEEKSLAMILDIAQRAKTPDFKAVALAKSEQSGEVVEMRGRTAIINVIGPIFRYANLFTAISGATSTDELSAAFGKALNDPQIGAILFNFDSPGGAVAGISELAQAIAAGRGVKPIWAYVDDIAASGAYWLASAAERIILADTSIVGSIGVISTIRAEKDDPEAGKAYHFISSVSPHKRLDLESQDGQKRVQEMVDDLGQVFVSAVARNRNASGKQVIDQFGGGFLLTAAKALNVGMADEIGTFESALAQLKRITESKERGFKMNTETAAIESGKQDKTAITVASETASVSAEAKTKITAAASPEGESADIAGVRESAAQISELCNLAGQPRLAAAFIRNQTPLAEVRSALMNARAEGEAELDIQSRVLPATSASVASRSPSESILVRAAEKIAESTQK